MNYNANATPRPPFSKKVKRVSDVNAMGYNPYDPQGQGQAQGNLYPNLPSTPFQPVQQGYGPVPQQGYVQPNFQPGVAMFNQPLVQDMAMQYGQQLAGAGKNIIKQEVEKYVPVSKLKYYFAVDTKYVMKKLLLLFFPFTHSDWTIKYEQDGPVQPRYEINAPDLYIPTMSYVTYVLTAGLVLGMQQRFTPEQISILASSALAWCLVELAVYSCTLYITQVETSLKTLDLLAFSGYKFVGTIFSIIVSIVGGRRGYYAALVYTSFTLAIFLVRSLKAQVLVEASTTGYYGQAPTGHKRRLYFLLFLAGVQPLLSWWLSFHLLNDK